MVYSKVTTLRNLGDKSIGEASTTRQDLLLPITIILHKASKIISGTFPALWLASLEVHYIAQNSFYMYSDVAALNQLCPGLTGMWAKISVGYHLFLKWLNILDWTKNGQL